MRHIALLAGVVCLSVLAVGSVCQSEEDDPATDYGKVENTAEQC